MNNSNLKIHRFRIYYSKKGPLRFTSNLDMQKIWERTMRRAGQKLSYSLGFHPQPHIQQASPLPLGFESQTEIVDIWLENRVSDSVLQISDLQCFCPLGLTINQIHEIKIKDNTLQNCVFASNYQITFLNSIEKKYLEEVVAQLKQNEIIQRTKRGKKYNLRPLINTIHVKDLGNDKFCLFMQLKTMPGATGRPDEVLKELGINPAHTIITRTAILFISHDGQ